VTAALWQAQETTRSAPPAAMRICEKPLANHALDAAEMYEAVEAAGVRHQTCFNFRFVAAVQYASELISDGALGRTTTSAGSGSQIGLWIGPCP